MAIEKILQTRILNKVDTLENWDASSLPIKKGEICIATVAASAGTGLTEPVVMIKIGEDGVKTFKDLPWNFYAKASDVLTACKSEEGLTGFVNDVIDAAGLATSSAMSTLSGRVTTAEGKITAAEGDIAALEGLVGDTKVATQISNAITALNLSTTYAAKVHTHTKADITDFAHTHAMTEVTGLTDAIADAKKAGTDANTALESYKVTNNAAVQANADAIAAINNVDTGILAQAKSYADGKDAAIAAAKKAGDDAQADVDALEAKVGAVADGKTVVQMIAEAQAAATYNDTEVRGLISDNADAIGALEDLVGDTKVSTQIKDYVDGLNLSTTYEAKGTAAAVKTELVGTAADTDASATIAGAKKYADKLDAAMDARVQELETAIGEGGSVGAQIDAKIQELDVEDAEVTGQYVSAVSETDGKISVTRKALPDYTDIYAPKTHTHAIADVTGLQTELDKVTTLVGTDAGKSARTIANEELAAQLIPENAKESLDTLQEIAAWIQAHPDDASAMNTRIGALETKVGDSSVSAQINAAIDALKIGDYAKAADLTAAVARIAANETDIATLKGTGEGSVAKAVSDAVAALDVEDTAIDHQVVTAVSETDGKIAVTRAQLTTDDIAAGTEVWVFDCGDSTN